MQRARAVDPMDDPDTLDRATGRLDPFVATPRARADTANIMSRHSVRSALDCRSGTLAHHEPIGMARDVFSLARTDPDAACAAADRLLADSLSVSRPGSLFGAEPEPAPLQGEA